MLSDDPARGPVAVVAPQEMSAEAVPQHAGQTTEDAAEEVPDKQLEQAYVLL